MLVINVIPVLIEYWTLFSLGIKKFYNKFHLKCAKIKNKYYSSKSFKFMEKFFNLKKPEKNSVPD